MSSIEDIDDLEEGEITEINSFDSPFGHNSVSNEVSKNDISPIFQSLLSQETDPLFGSSDTDLRVTRNPNAFNDCDERLVMNTVFGVETSFDPKPRPVVQNNPNVKTNSLPPIHPNYGPSSENRFHSFSSRSRVPLHRSPFKVPENTIPVRLRSPLRALLPTPPYPPRQILPFPTDPVIYSPFVPQSNAQSIHTNQSIAFEPKEWTKETPESLVIPPSNRLNPTIPFICETTISQIQTETPAETQSNGSKIQDLNINQISGETNIKTIVIGSNEDIQEVQMQVSDADEPYDPEQDISLLCSPLSPPFVSPQKIGIIRENNTSNITPFVLNDSKVESNSKFQNSNKSHSKRNENKDRNERLNRLLKSHNSFNDSKKRRITGKPSKKESLRMTPKVLPKFVDTMKPISTSSTKRVVHNKSCKKNHKSRRKMKRIAKRKVFSEKVLQNDRNEMNDSSYEDLLQEYERIKQQLQELESEEKNETIIEKDIDSQEKERIENLFNTEDISEISNDSKVIEDDDENELRRLALESKMRREMKIAAEKEADEEEELLRQQLLQSLKSKSKSLQTIEESNEISNEANERKFF